MTKLLCAIFLVLVLVGCASSTPTPPAEPIELRLATIPPLSRLAQDLSQNFSQTYPYARFELSVMSAREAIDAVARRDIDVALVAEPIDPGRGSLKSTQIGRQAVVLAVHPSNPVEALTWDQVRDIFSGQVWDWAAVDARWQSQEILVVSQHARAVSRLAFEKHVMEGIRVTPRAIVATGDEVAGKLIAEEPAAIGYLLAGVASDSVKVLTIEGTEPSASAVKTGAWPITRPINLVTHIDANVYVLDFVDFSRGSLR
ncbi:MAG: substrate-binding domain-containing protein [Anaerolineae bacterium]